jgi:F-type H+-transporting ATPase subunit delta
MSTGTLARRYARALLELATEQRLVDRVKKDLEELNAMWASSPELRELFANPGFEASVKKAALNEIITRAGVSPLVRNAVLYLSDRNRIVALPEVTRSFTDLAEQAAGTVRAEVTSAAALPESYYLQLQRTLEQATGKRVAIEKKTDASLIAGVVTRVGDRVFDGSIRTRLADLKESLKSA